MANVGNDVVGSTGDIVQSFRSWRIHAARQQLARASLLIVLAIGVTLTLFMIPAILQMVFPQEEGEDDVDAEQTPSCILLFEILGMFLHFFLAAPWLRHRPETTFDTYLNLTLAAIAVCFDVNSFAYMFASAEVRSDYKAGHVLDGLWPCVMLSMFDIERLWYYCILGVHALVWSFSHLLLCDFGMAEAMPTIIPVLTYFLLLAVSTHGRMGTLRDCFEMNLLRKEAEDGYRRFLSYMMHEMRNPIGGAMFLLDYLEFTSRRALSSLETKRKGSVVAGPREDLSVGGVGKEKEKGTEKTHVSADEKTSESFLTTQLRVEMEFLQKKIRGSLEAMKSVCDDVLTLEKVQKRGFEYIISNCDPLVWLRELSDLERLSIQSSNLDFNVNIEIAPDLDEALASKRMAVAADWLHLRQVAVNFLSNARKFTKAKGKITLRFQIERLLPSTVPPECCIVAQSQGSEGRSKNKNLCDVVRTSAGLPSPSEVCGWVRMELSVTDTGEGLSASEKEKLFLPYSQIRAGELQRGGGTGLGLCISKMFVEAHWGGRVGAESEGQGRGSTFSFSLCAPLISLEQIERRGVSTQGGNRNSRRGSREGSFPFSSFVHASVDQLRGKDKNRGRGGGGHALDPPPVSLGLGESVLLRGPESRGSLNFTSRVGAVNVTGHQQSSVRAGGMRGPNGFQPQPSDAIASPLISRFKRAMTEGQKRNILQVISDARSETQPSKPCSRKEDCAIQQQKQEQKSRTERAAESLASNGSASLSQQNVTMSSSSRDGRRRKLLAEGRAVCTTRTQPETLAENEHLPFQFAGEYPPLTNANASFEPGRVIEGAPPGVLAEVQEQQTQPQQQQQSEKEKEKEDEEEQKEDSGVPTQQENLLALEELPPNIPPQMAEQVRAYAKDFDCLVVDDIWICAFGAFRAMERLGFRPWMCLSGERALEVLSCEGASERVRVILMDKDMPGIDGPETVRRLRTFFKQQRMKQPTVVGITGEVAGPGMAALKEAGADAVLPKPCRPEALEAELKRLGVTTNDDK